MLSEMCGSLRELFGCVLHSKLLKQRVSTLLSSLSCRLVLEYLDWQGLETQAISAALAQSGKRGKRGVFTLKFAPLTKGFVESVKT